MNPSIERLREYADANLPGVIFITISGSHLYGFDSPDSDVDLRGTFAASTREILSLRPPKETIETKDIVDGVEVEMVGHEIAKYLRLLVKPNGYVLEQICSPLVVCTSDVHQQLIALAKAGLSRGLYRHYHGFASGELRNYHRGSAKTVKQLLYLHRVLMTGIVLLQSGEVEMNLHRLADRLGYDVESLVALKRLEKAEFEGDVDPILARIDELFGLLDKARDESPLPEEVPNRAEIDDFLVSLRLLGVVNAEPLKIKG